MSRRSCGIVAAQIDTAQVLRRLVREGTVSANRADEAVQDLLDLRLTRYPHSYCCPEFGSSATISAYDAAYVGLAEKLGAPLITRDGRLAAAPGHAATIELF
jgi:predicted nucleic acid-binding protein